MKYLLLLITIVFLWPLQGQNESSITEKSRHEKWIEDINYFESEFLNKAKSYSDESRENCRKHLDSLKNEINELSDFKIRLELCECVALANNAHTSIPFPLYQQIPIRLYRFSDGLYITKAGKEYAQYLGAKVLKINDKPVNEIEKALSPYLSGEENWKKFKSLGLLVTPKLLYELGLGEKEFISLTLEKESNLYDVNIKKTNVENDWEWYETWGNLFPTNEQKSTWEFLKNDKDKLPLYLKRANEGVFYDFNDNRKLAYFQINSFWYKRKDFKKRIREFIKLLKTKSDYDVVIDLRYHTGGNYGLSTKLAKRLPKAIDNGKKIFLITSNKTFSAGIVTAARVKYFGKDRIVVVGEKVGDKLKFWAESKVVKLPNSGISIFNPQKEHDWIDNKLSLSKTHLANFIYGVPAKDLNLDKEIKMSFLDYMNQKDPVMEWIINNK